MGKRLTLRWMSLTLMVFALPLVGANKGCSTLQGVEPCDILVDIPKAPASVNRVIVAEAPATARGIVKNQERVALYKCEQSDG